MYTCTKWHILKNPIAITRWCATNGSQLLRQKESPTLQAIQVDQYNIILTRNYITHVRNGHPLLMGAIGSLLTKSPSSV